MTESPRGYDALATRASLASIRHRANLRRLVLAAFFGFPTVVAWITQPHGCGGMVVDLARIVFTPIFAIAGVVMLVTAIRQRSGDRAALEQGAAAAQVHHRKRVGQALRATGWLRLSWMVALVALVLWANLGDLAGGAWDMRDHAAGLLFAAFLNGVIVHRRYFLRPRLLRERAALDEVAP